MLIKKKINHYENHPKPITRRDFLARGIIGFSAYAMMPGVLGMLARQQMAMAAEGCPEAGGSSSFPAFVVFDMAGGGALAGNWVPLDQGGGLLPSYGKMGLGSTSTLTVESKFGAALARNAIGQTNVSKVLQGIEETASPDAQAKLRMGLICGQSNSDNSTNQHSAVLQVARGGIQGALLRNGVGTNNSNFGGNSQGPTFDATLKPLRVGSFTDLQGAVGYPSANGQVFNGLTKSQLDAMAKASKKLTEGQRAALNQMSLGQQMAELARCGFVKNEGYTGGASGIDPREDATFQSVYGITTGTAVNNRAVVTSTIVMNALKGNTGPGVISIGGCDYHNGTQNTGDGKDLELGREIGRAVEAAFRMGKPLVFQVLTDGGIYSQQDNRNWQGDSDDKTLVVVGYFNPAAAPELIRTQIGYFTGTMTNQGAAAGTLVGNNPAMMANVVALNYYAIAKRIDLFQKVAGLTAIPPERINDMLLFG